MQGSEAVDVTCYTKQASHKCCRRKSNCCGRKTSLSSTSKKSMRKLISKLHKNRTPGRVALSVMCLTTDAHLTADPGVVSSIPAQSHTFEEFDHKIISTVILLPSAPLIHSGRCVVSFKRKYVHVLLVNSLFKLAQNKVWLGELTP